MGSFIIMVYKCCVVGCCSNYAAEEANTVFFPKDDSIRKNPNHFKPKYFRKGQKNKTYRLIKKLKPVPTIFNPTYFTKSSSSSNLISPASIPRKSPRKRIFQEGQYETFLADDSIKN